jgi:hypothetical protein
MKGSFAVVITVLLLNGISNAQDFGMITDISGKATAIRNGKQTALDVGNPILAKDILQIPKSGTATLVAYSNCLEWLVSGSGEIMVENDKITAVKGASVKAGKKLTVCYKPGNIKGAGSHSMGAVSLFSKESNKPFPEPAGSQGLEQASITTGSDPVIDSLKQEFRDGKASNSTVISLIMHELNADRVGLAKPYYVELKKRAPESSVVKDMAPSFEGVK